MRDNYRALEADVARHDIGITGNSLATASNSSHLLSLDNLLGIVRRVIPGGDADAAEGEEQTVSEIDADGYLGKQAQEIAALKQAVAELQAHHEGGGGALTLEALNELMGGAPPDS